MLAGAVTHSFASLVQINLSVPTLALKDGTTHRDVTIKTFDPAIGRVMILEGKTFTTEPISFFPDDLAAKLRSMAPPQASEPEKPSTVVPAPAAPRPSAPPPEVTRSHEEKALSPERAEAAARAAIKAHAYNYFRYTYRFGSNSVTVRSVAFEWQEIEAVQGWTGRYRMAGKAYIDYFDSVGNSFSRIDPAFEILCDVSGKGATKIIDVTTK